MSVHLHCVESFEGLLQQWRRGRGCSVLRKNTIFHEHPVSEINKGMYNDNASESANVSRQWIRELWKKEYVDDMRVCFKMNCKGRCQENELYMWMNESEPGYGIGNGKETFPIFHHHAYMNQQRSENNWKKSNYVRK